ncbi:YHS domain-containing (seleno)protein [Devosia sp.]|uniref:YHS domain-containing (seleno)protein n=1 Tax=Devosia sp. TaxID=1871048 RepID=UPI003BAAFF9C
MRQKRKQILTITAAIAFGLALCTLPVAARAAALVETVVTDPISGIAIEGYDPVTYFIDGNPQPGLPDFEYQWQGVPWYFVSAANRDIFIRNPEIYAPQYGGHCVTSLSRGYLSDGKPRLFLIRGMKLYFFYSVANRDAFLQSEAASVRQASNNWVTLETGLTGEEQSVADAVGDPAGAVDAPKDGETAPPH